MQYAEKLVAVLVKRLGGRVEIPMQELDAAGRDGEVLVGYKSGVKWEYVLEVRQPSAVELPIVLEEAPKATMDIIGLGGHPSAPLDSPAAKQWKADMAERAAWERPRMPVPGAMLRTAYEQMQVRADNVQPVEPRSAVVNRDELEG